MTNNLRIPVPSRRPPRLPRDHFAMRPKISGIQRIMRAILLVAVSALAVAIYLHPHIK
jgi:hypothetical protein